MNPMKFCAVALLTGALAVAPAAAQRGPGGPRGHGPLGGGDPARMLTRLATVLDLTEAQKTAAQAVFSNAKTQSEPVQTALREANQAVQAAVTSNKSDSEIDTLTARSGALMGQAAAIRAKAHRAFLQLLTTQQREKLDALHGQMGPRRGPRQ